MPSLQELARKGITEPSLIYARDAQGKQFKVYDYSRSFPEFRHRDDRFFARVESLKGEERELAQYIRQEGQKFHHVEGKSLRQTVERAVIIYNSAEKLRKAR